ncbi:MAG: peptidoglycan editing factor PgeF [Terriglobia bacterium]
MTARSFETCSHADVEWLEARNLRQFPWLLHAFSTRHGGFTDLDLGTADCEQPAAVRANRQRFFAAIGAAGMALASVRQIHSSIVLQVRPGPKRELQYSHCGPAPVGAGEIPEGDALLTESPGVLLSVRTADCLPVLIVDPQNHAVAAIHAGWRGGLGRIIEKTVAEMRRVFRSEPRYLFVALGPSIRACCYEVGEEVIDAFAGQFANSNSFFRKIPLRRDGKAPIPEACANRRPALPQLSEGLPGPARPHGTGVALDLVAVALEQLRDVPRSHIQVASFCTSCRNDLLFSWRKEGSHAGRMMAVIGIRN